MNQNQNSVVLANLIEIGTRIRENLEKHPKLSNQSFISRDRAEVITARLQAGLSRDAEEQTND